MSRNTDIYSLESRVNALETDIEPKPIRSYDIYSLEKRIYNLEQGGSPTPPTPPEPETATLLWTNNNAGVAFSAQTISIDMTEYETCIVEFKVNRNVTSLQYRCSRVLLFKDDERALFGGATGDEVYARSVSFNDDGVTFSNGLKGYKATNNDNMIPLRIYGFKTKLF